MMQFIRVCGLAGGLSLVLTIFLALVIIGVVCLSRTRRPLSILALVALLPLLVGILGTAAGYRQVEKAMKRVESPDDGLMRRGRGQARYTTYLGAGGTVFLWLLVGVAAAVKKPGEGVSNQ